MAHKILLEVLASCLKFVLPLVVSDSHNAFVRDKQILDAVLVANGVEDSRSRSQRPRLICKLFIEKVYDHVNRDFLLYYRE